MANPATSIPSTASYPHTRVITTVPTVPALPTPSTSVVPSTRTATVTWKTPGITFFPGNGTRTRTTKTRRSTSNIPSASSRILRSRVYGKRIKLRNRSKLVSILIFIVAHVLGLLLLGIYVYISVTIFDTTIEDVSLSPVHKLFGTGFHSPQSLYWDNLKGNLYFMDPNTGNGYRWKPSFGKYHYDYSLIDYKHTYFDRFDPTTWFDDIFKDTRPYKFNFMMPWNNSVDKFVTGFGPVLVDVEWNPDFKHRTTKAWFRKQGSLCNQYQEVSVGKASPAGTLVVGCRDVLMHKYSQARVIRFHKKETILKQTYPYRFSPKLVHITGITWSTDVKTVYMLDTVTWTIILWTYKMAYDSEVISDPVLLVTFTDKPHDVQVDSENYLWVTLMGSNTLVRVSTASNDASSRIKAIYRVPGRVTYGLVLGGPTLDMIIVSTGHVMPSNLVITEHVKTKTPGNFYYLNVSVKAGPIYHLSRARVLPFITTPDD